MFDGYFSWISASRTWRGEEPPVSSPGKISGIIERSGVSRNAPGNTLHGAGRNSAEPAEAEPERTHVVDRARCQGRIAGASCVAPGSWDCAHTAGAAVQFTLFAAASGPSRILKFEGNKKFRKPASAIKRRKRSQSGKHPERCVGTRQASD